MALVSSVCQHGPLSRTSKSLQMHLALWATELSFNPTGFVVPGQWRKGRRQLHTRNFFQLLLLPLCGALTGCLGGSSSCVTTSLWWPYSSLVPRGTRVLCSCCAIFPCWPFVIHFCLLLPRFGEKVIPLLMLSLAFNFSGSDAWHLMQTWPRPRSLRPSWLHFRCPNSKMPVPSYSGTGSFYTARVSLSPTSVHKLLPPGWSC